MQKVHVLTIRASLSFTKPLMFLWTIQTVHFTDPEFPLQKYLWWSCRCLRNTWRHKHDEGGVGGPVPSSSWGCGVHNLSPLHAPQEKAHARKNELLQIQTMFSATLILLLWSDQRQKHDTQTASKPKDGLSICNLLAPFHLPLNISWLSKTYHLSLEKGILSWTDFTWFPEEACFWSLMAA